MRLTAEQRTAMQDGGELYALALKEKRELTEQEQTEVRNIERQLDADEYHQLHGGDAGRRFTEAATEQRSIERPRILTPELRMVDYVRGSYPTEHDSLSLGRYIRGYLTGNWQDADLERRAMAEGTLGAGGAMVPTPLSASVIDNIRNQAVVFRAGARVVPMSTPTLKYARLKADPTAAWTPENTTISDSDGEFEAVTFTAMKLAALVKMSIELIEDAPNSSSVLENALAQVLALELDRVVHFGNGVTEPKGIHAYANTIVPEVVMGADGAQITSYDKFSDAYFTVLANNITPKVAVYAPRTAKTLDQLKTAVDLTPLPAPPSWSNLSKFVSNQIPVNIVQGNANNTSPAFIGDYAGVGVGMRTQLVIEASREAGTAFEDGQIWCRAYLRGDVQLLVPKALCVVRGILPQLKPGEPITMRTRIVILLALVCAAASAQTVLPTFVAFREFDGIEEAVTIQQSASPSKTVIFQNAAVECSAGCTVTIERDGGAATDTALTPVAVSNNMPSATALAFHTSDSSSGTVLAKWSIQAGDTLTLDLAGMRLARIAGRNVTIRTNGAEGLIRISLKWTESE